MKTSTFLGFGARAEVLKNMQQLRRVLPKTGITTEQFLVSEHVLTPLVHTEKAAKTDPGQLPKALALGVLYEMIAVPVFAGLKIRNKVLPPDPVGTKQRKNAVDKAFKLAEKITNDPEMDLGLDDFAKAHSSLTPNETMFLNGHRDRKGQVTRLPILVKIMDAIVNGK